MPFFGSGGGASVANMVGATSSVAGTAGLVPAPAAGDNEATLIGDATFAKNLFQRNLKPVTKTSRYYFNAGLLGRPEDANTANYSSTGHAVLVPFFVAGTETVASITFMNHSVNASTVTFKLAVYQSDFLTGAPTTLVQQVQTANIGNNMAAGTLVTTNFSASVRGLYWVAVFNETSVAHAIKSQTTPALNPVLMQIAGSEAFSNGSQRRAFGIKSASIPSNVYPSTLSSSDFTFPTTADSCPTLAVVYS